MFVTATKTLRPTLLLFVFVAFCLAFTSCSTVKDYPVNQPFVYEYNVALNGKFNTEERKQLRDRLENQLHDSIKVRRLQKLIFWNTLKNPPVYDSLNADKSVIYMRALLNSLGYYRDTITYDTTLHIEKANKGNQYRTTVNFDIYPGKLITLDSIAYNFQSDTLEHFAQATMDTLQKITQANLDQSLVKKGSPFAISLIASERDRLTDVYRNNGYLRFSSEELITVWDTLGVDLLRPTLDPIEQAQQLEALRLRRLNPTADLEFRLRANEDTSHLTRFYVGDVTIYPDLAVDTANYVPRISTINGYTVISYFNLYKRKVLAENVYLNRGELYSQRNYLKTINRFNAIGSWRLVTVDQIPRGATDTVDFMVRLTPAPKHSFNVNIEGSQNIGNTNSALPTGNLVGFNVGFQNRNFSRGANLATTNFRFATEVLSQQFGRSKLLSFSNAIYFPRAIPHLNFIPAEWKENIKTVFTVNANYTQRNQYFEPYIAYNGSWGYEFNRKNKLLGIRVPNIEYTLLTPGDSLDKLMANNVSYRYIYNSGLVASVIANLTLTGGKEKVSNMARFNFESSGLATGIFRNTFLKENLHRFVKLDAEFRQIYKVLPRSDFAWRVFAGAGYQFASNYFENNRTLPFFKSYFAGGANSMRAWALRKLGPGSVVRSFDVTEAPERYGDIQLETNAEYRFYLTEIQGVNINSAVFTDIGNIWTMREDVGGFGEAGMFRPGKLWTDLAIGAGTGLRVDFGFFLIRLDYAYKVKDPSPDEYQKQNKWFYNWKLLNGQPQLGVTYPF